MKNKKFDINQLLYIKTVVFAFVRSSCYCVIRYFRRILKICLTFLKRNKQLSVKLLIPLFIICITYYACSTSKRVIHKNIQEIFMISDEIRAHYADRPDYWGLSTKEIINKKILPNKFIKNNMIVLSSGVAINVGSGINADTVMPLSQTFDVIVKYLNKAQCISYAESPLQNEDLLKVYSIRILNNSGDFIFEWGGNRSLPIERYATKDVCSDIGNTVIWAFK